MTLKVLIWFHVTFTMLLALSMLVFIHVLVYSHGNISFKLSRDPKLLKFKC